MTKLKGEGPPGSGPVPPIPRSSPGGPSSPSTLAHDTTLPLSPDDAWSRTTTRLRFSSDDDRLIAGRYRVVRLIAEGGMGEVYEVEDAALGERVALKTIRPDVCRDARALERFKREIQLARKVTHPNVCRIFDLGFDRVASASAGPGPGPSGEAASSEEVAFLTMELLTGHTLAERLAEHGRMEAARVLPIAQQMAEALRAAHEAGVIHRDFKSANVVLVEGGERGSRVVVTDFGLACASVPDSTSSLRTGLADFVGSPAYMAPEQVEGGEVTHAADVYALGVVLFEMVTGRLPFLGDSPLQTAVKRLKEPPPEPRSLVPELDPVWQAVILRCLERDPARRFASAKEVAEALTRSPPPGGEASTDWSFAGEQPEVRRTLRQTRVRTRLALLAVVALVALAGGFGLWLLRGGTTDGANGDNGASSGQPPARVRRSLAVLGFKNLSGRAEAAWLSTALAEMLGADLGAQETIRVVPAENVARLKLELGLADVDTFARDTLVKIHKNLGADWVLLGSYLAMGEAGRGSVRIDLRLQDTASGETLALAHEEGPEGELLALVGAAGLKLREKLGLGQLSREQAGGVRAALPSGHEAARLYAEGLAELRQFNVAAARERLTGAITLDPKYPLAHAALAEALGELGQERDAQKEAKAALGLAEGLPRADKMTVEARYREAMGQWPQAIALYRSLFEQFPDSLEHGLALARAQVASGAGKDAIGVIEALRKLPLPAAGDPRIDLAEAQAARSLGDYTRAAASASHAAAKGRALGARLLGAQGLEQHARALLGLGDLAGAERAAAAALAIWTELGDRVSEGRALVLKGQLLFLEGKLADAERVLLPLPDQLREVGQRSQVGEALSCLGQVLGAQGDLSGARKRQNEALAIFEELGRPALVAQSRRELAELALERDEPAEAETIARDSIAALEGQPMGEEAVLSHLMLARALTELEAYDEAAPAIVREGNFAKTSENRLLRICAALAEARVRLAQGNAAEGRSAAARALEEAQKGGFLGRALEARLVIAELDLGGGAAEAAHTSLAAIERDALAAGFGRLARRANAVGRH